jgi:dTDP-4-dehydrorhamnose reductase
MIDSVFITGGSGLLALNWAMALRDRATITLALYDRTVTLGRVSTLPASLETIDQVVRALDVTQPQIVIHTAGLTSVEACEKDEGLAHHVNVEIAGNVAAACAQLGVSLVHISTDHLFRGDQALVTEHQPVDPQNAYARTKVEAERRVLDSHPEALVIRTNFYGWGPRFRQSFSDTIIGALRRGKPITLFTDVFYTPILADTLSLAVHDLVRAKTCGIVHVSGDERVSKYDFGLRVAAHFELDASLIRPGRLTDQSTLARRPFDMSLSNVLARRVLGHGLCGIDEHLTRLRQQEQDGLAQELQNV